MLKEKRNQLINKLQDIIYNVANNDKVIQSVGSEFINRNLDSRNAMLVIQGNFELSTLMDSEEDIRFLFLFTYALSKALSTTDNYNISVEDYFTQTEINRWVNFKAEKEDQNIFPISFRPAIEVSEGHWITVSSNQKVHELNSANILLYNPNTQREMKVVNGRVRINSKNQKIEDISKRIKSGEQFEDDLKLNILKGTEEIKYDPKALTLTIFNGVINIWDGYNRKEGSEKALRENPNIPFNWVMHITNYSEIKTHDCMTQINKQTKIKEEHLAPKDYSKKENLVVSRLMDFKGDLSTNLRDTKEMLKVSGLTTKYICSEAIKEQYKIENSSEVEDIAKWLNEFFNYLMGLYVDEFLNKPEYYKNISYINDKKIFAGYIALSSVLYNNKNWKLLLKQKMESIDFSKDNAVWKEIGLHVTKDMNSTTREKLYNYMKEGVINV